jgi:hypothetical protein
MRDNIHKAKMGVAIDMRFDDFIYKYGGTANLRTQLNWLKSADGQIKMDFIGKFENLQRDFKHVCEVLGVKDVVLQHELKGGTENYASYYDRKLRNYIYNLYQEEIELFGYKFGI